MSVRSENENMSVGNASAMREALELVLRFLQWMYAQEGENAATSKVQIADKIDRVIFALSAPPRNCDRFNNEMEMQFAFLAELLSMGINGASLEEYSKWLLAEAKGASNESK